MIALVAAWAFAEATLWFVVADVPISAIGLHRGLRPALAASLAAAVAAAVGGLVTMRISAAHPEAVRSVLERVPGIGAASIDAASADMAARGWTAALTGSFSGVPYKLYAHAAGLGGGMDAARFAAASFLVRLPRFLLVAAASCVIGRVLRRRMGTASIAVAHGAFWILFYVAYLTRMGS